MEKDCSVVYSSSSNEDRYFWGTELREVYKRDNQLVGTKARSTIHHQIQAIPFIGWLTYPSLHWKSHIPKLLHTFCPIRLIRWMSTIKRCHKDFTGSRSVVCAKLRIEGGVVSIVQSGPITMWSDTTIFAHARIRGDSPQNSKMWCITTDIIAKPGRPASQKMWCEATL